MQPLKTEAVYGANNGYPSKSRLDLKRRTILRIQNFDRLIKPLEPIRSNSEEGSIPCENGDVGVSVGISPPTMSEDLRAMILRGFQASQPADEDVFDDIGTGEDVEELVESE
ncbi:unnamed protein product [Hymenolepis diminuta]|uniref:CACTA en-spm transposon protein n=1 Tax=Hymenolepis diminuta TaxID=6216 RepID=A0A158QBI9_HYMDI|nr:unnamed protein product [Hymenolepis diminuta]